MGYYWYWQVYSYQVGKMRYMVKDVIGHNGEAEGVSIDYGVDYINEAFAICERRNLSTEREACGDMKCKCLSIVMELKSK